MSNAKYILVGKKPKAVDLMTWATWFEGSGEKRRVASSKGNGVHVSTVFLGLDHQYGNGPPLLFETMIFGGPHDEEMWRYSTWEEAEDGHKAACAIAGLEPQKKPS